MSEPRRDDLKCGTDGPGTENAAGAGIAAGVGWQTGLGGHQGQIGHRGRQVQLEFCLGAPEVAGLADSQLDQPRQPVLHHHPALPVFAKGFTLLQGPGLLQQRLLRVQLHRPSCARCRGHALGPQRAHPADRSVELEGLQLVSPACCCGASTQGPDSPGNVPRRTGAGARLQVNMEVLFRKVFPVWAARHPGNQGVACVGEGLPGVAVSVGGVAHGLLHRHTGVVLRQA